MATRAGLIGAAIVGAAALAALAGCATRHAGPISDHFDGREFGNAELPPAGALRVSYVGHATVLLQVAGLNILIDPVWSERASPVSLAGPKRSREPAIAFEDLPPIDLMLVSQDHHDHFDTATLARLIGERPIPAWSRRPA